MRESVKPFIDFIEEEGWTHVQQQALVDVMVWTMYVDRSIRVEENEAIDEVIEEMNEESALPISQYLNESFAKIRSVWHIEDRASLLLENIATILDDQEIRQKAYQLSEKIASSDGSLVGEETAFLAALKTAFAL